MTTFIFLQEGVVLETAMSFIEDLFLLFYELASDSGGLWIHPI